MTNGEKYKTAHERAMAFKKYCANNQCDNNCELCTFAWLDLECEEDKRSFCFYCKHQSVEIVKQDNGYIAKCACCDYQSQAYDSKVDAYCSHNRVAKAVRER